MEFANNVRLIRLKRGLTQEQLAEMLAVSRQSVAKWESGQTSLDIQRLLELSQRLDVSVDRLLKPTQPCMEGNGAGHICTSDLVAFICRASLATYAGFGKEEAEGIRSGSHDFRYAEESLLYTDSYVGGEIFGGEEVVYAENRPIWLMNYCGRVLDGGFSGDFLKEALRNRPLELPFRGPLHYSRNEFSYHNRVNGDMRWFSGAEEIFCDNMRVYECNYHGGLLVN